MRLVFQEGDQKATDARLYLHAMSVWMKSIVDYTHTSYLFKIGQAQSMRMSENRPETSTNPEQYCGASLCAQQNHQLKHFRSNEVLPRLFLCLRSWYSHHRCHLSKSLTVFRANILLIQCTCSRFEDTFPASIYLKRVIRFRTVAK